MLKQGNGHPPGGPQDLARPSDGEGLRQRPQQRDRALGRIRWPYHLRCHSHVVAVVIVGRAQVHHRGDLAMMNTNRSAMPAAVDVARARSETPGCANVVHPNNAGAALTPAPVLDAVIDTVLRKAR
ncbi:hypothetical protein [Nonomuraea basaltis]|uniref:hypothetical protein n=1 Tax=Nonomuraea basaltis TaxID=2495887 RepID=UPI001F11899F|nr:hypothetical protein [Nonomuraea basaltis]